MWAESYLRALHSNLDLTGLVPMAAIESSNHEQRSANLPS